MRTTTQLFIVCIATSSVAACAPGDDLDLPPITWRGQHIEFGTDVSTEICPQTLSSMDEYMGGVAEYARSNTTYPIRYYYLQESLDRYGFGCPDDSFGCVRTEAGRSIVGSVLVSHRHELIHASSIASQHRLLEEGLSMFLGTNLLWAGVAEPSTIRAAFDDVEGTHAGLPPEHYPVAGHFVSFLADKYGLANVVTFVEASQAGMPLDELAELSVQHFGTDLRLDIEEYEASGPGCEVAQFSPTWFECELAPPSIPIFACGADQTRIAVDITLSCADGASGVQDGMIWKDILIEAPAPGLKLINLIEGHPVEFTVRSCGQGCSTPFARISSPSADEGPIFDAFELSEGLNLIRITKPIEAAGRVRFSIAMPCP